jgi:hypothetical protein
MLADDFVEILAVLDQYKDTMGAIGAIPISRNQSHYLLPCAIVSYPLNPFAGGRKNSSAT